VVVGLSLTGTFRSSTFEFEATVVLLLLAFVVVPLSFGFTTVFSRVGKVSLPEIVLLLLLFALAVLFA